MASDGNFIGAGGGSRGPYDVRRAFMRIEDDLIASMMRNLGRHLKEEQDEGFDWSQWQVEQLKYLEEYRRRNRETYGPRFDSINEAIEEAILYAHQNGQKDEELHILDAISKDRKIRPRYANPSQPSIEAGGDAFFRVNDRKLEALVEAAHSDMQAAEHAVLRRVDDQYRRIIFDAQVYANTGAGTVEKAVDMATKDFLMKGIDSIQYRNGARHTISDYADMYIRTAERRAYLMGEGKKRQEWGEQLVIVNRRGTMKNGNFGHACPQCIPWLGRILIDDVYSGGKPDGKHDLLSDAMAQGFLHPRCRDGFTTYFPGISPQEDPVTRKEVKEAVEAEKEENQLQYAERQQERYERLAEYSLDPENRRLYKGRAEQWEEEYLFKQSFVERASRIKTEADLNRVSKSDIINLSTYEEIVDYFSRTYEIEVKNFDKKDLFSVKSVLAGYDDFLKEFTDLSPKIHTIEYNPRLKVFGKMSPTGVSLVGPLGLGDYGTGVHEAAHALDFALSKAGTHSFAESIVEQARKNLKLRKNSKKFVNLLIRMTGSFEDSNLPYEVFAYAIETVKAGPDNEFANEVFRLLEEQVR